jgi:hypothetical protein
MEWSINAEVLLFLFVPFVLQLTKKPEVEYEMQLDKD